MASDNHDKERRGTGKAPDDPATLDVVSGQVTLLPSAWLGGRGRWVVAVVIIVAAALASGGRLTDIGGGAQPSATSGLIAETTPSPTQESPRPSTPLPSDAPVPDPPWTIDLLGQLDCAGPPSTIGGEVGEVFGEGLSPQSPEAAMDTFIANAVYASFPTAGFERSDFEGHWARFVHSVEGDTKAVVVLRNDGPEVDPGIWSVVALRACDPAEFAPESGFTGGLLTVWLDAEDQRVPTTILHEIQGPGHCGWESTIWLRLDGELYLRDPDDVLEEAVVGSFDPDVALPTDAQSTGYHEGGRTIWRDDDPAAIYVVMADRVERWPRALDPFMGCA